MGGSPISPAYAGFDFRTTKRFWADPKALGLRLLRKTSAQGNSMTMAPICPGLAGSGSNL